MLLVQVERRHGLQGQDANGILINAFLQVTQDYIGMSIKCDYFMIDKGEICQLTVVQNTTRLVVRGKMNIRIMGQGVFKGEFIDI